MPLVDPVRRALSLNTLRVSHASRPSDFLYEFEKWGITHCLVFTDTQQFVGVVDLRAIVGQSLSRIFADLLPEQVPPALPADASLEELSVTFRDTNVTCVVIHDAKGLCGVVTRDSFLQLLLHDRVADPAQLSGERDFER